MGDADRLPESPQDLYDRAPCGLFSCTLDGVVVSINDTLLNWLGHDRGQVVGASFERWLPPGDLLFAQTHVLPAVRLRGEVRELGLTLHRADGELLPVLVNALVQPGPGADARIRVAVMDVTQRVDQARALIAARREAEASEERVRVLQDASGAFACVSSVDALAVSLAEIGRNAFSATTSAVLLVDDQENLILAAGTHPLLTDPPESGPTPERDAARSGMTVVVGSLDDADATYPGLSSPMRAARLVALTATPILDDQRVLGVLMCFFRGARIFEDPMIELQRALARQAAQVMLRIRLEDERHRAREKSESLRHTARTVSTGLRALDSPQEMIELVAAGVGRALSAHEVQISVVGEQGLPHLDVFWPRESSHDHSPECDHALRDLVAFLWDGQVGHRRAEATDDLCATDDPCATPKARRYLGAIGAGPDSRILVPLGERELAIGLIAVSAMDPARLFTPSEKDFLHNVAAELTHNLLQASLLQAQEDTVQRLLQLDEEKRDLIANLNHELRTPLASIVGYADLIAEGIEGRGLGKVEAMLDAIHRSAARLQCLFENMLTASRRDGSQRHVEIERVDVAEILRSVGQALLPLAEANGVTIGLDVPHHLVIRSDRAGLDQAFTNLVGNAVKFSTRGGVVAVVARKVDLDDGVTVSIRDSGIGIAESDLPRIGSKLFRATNARAAAVPGSGLGLFISRDILSAVGGDLTLRSTIGVGTEVIVTVPGVDRRERVDGDSSVKTIRPAAEADTIQSADTLRRGATAIRPSPQDEGEPAVITLSMRENQILYLITSGLTNREIGARLGLTEKTVKNYVSMLLSKLGMERRSQAAVHDAERRRAPG